MTKYSIASNERGWSDARATAGLFLQTAYTPDSSRTNNEPRTCEADPPSGTSGQTRERVHRTEIRPRSRTGNIAGRRILQYSLSPSNGKDQFDYSRSA